MIRKFNYTGRKKIGKDRVLITLSENNGVKRFDVKLDLNDLNLPKDAKIYIDAYFKMSSKRYDFGKVGKVEPPVNSDLHNIYIDDTVYFRIKIVDESKNIGLILADCDNIIPVDVDEEETEKQSILPVRKADLGDMIWELEFSGNSPILKVNKDIPNIKSIVKNDKGFISLVYPAIIREILHHILIIEEYSDPWEDDDDRFCQWLQFSYKFTNTIPPNINKDNQEDEIDNYDEINEWINEVVRLFAKKNNMKSKYTETIYSEESYA